MESRYYELKEPPPGTGYCDLCDELRSVDDLVSMPPIGCRCRDGLACLTSDPLVKYDDQGPYIDMVVGQKLLIRQLEKASKRIIPVPEEKEPSVADSIPFPAGVFIDYTNWRGERRERLIIPCFRWFGSTPYHQTAQWLIDAYDVEKGQMRSFAEKGIHAWRPA